MSTFLSSSYRSRLDSSLNTAVSIIATSPDCGNESTPQVFAIRTPVRNAINALDTESKISTDLNIVLFFVKWAEKKSRTSAIGSVTKGTGLSSSSLSSGLRKILVYMLCLETSSTSAISLSPQDTPSPKSTTLGFILCSCEAMMQRTSESS